MIGAIGVLADAVDDRLTSGQRRAIWEINIGLRAALARDEKDAAIRQIQHCHNKRSIGVRGSRWSVDLSETVGKVIVLVKGSRPVEAIGRPKRAKDPAVDHHGCRSVYRAQASPAKDHFGT